jgi:hypothetical protein
MPTESLPKYGEFSASLANNLISTCSEGWRNCRRRRKM